LSGLDSFQRFNVSTLSREVVRILPFEVGVTKTAAGGWAILDSGLWTLDSGLWFGLLVVDRWIRWFVGPLVRWSVGRFWYYKQQKGQSHVRADYSSTLLPFLFFVFPLIPSWSAAKRSVLTIYLHSLFFFFFLG
jgi:hypothetical protein